MEPLRVIISGGGTGGHIFPAISIANAIKEICKKQNIELHILFVGAENRMEMQKVPAAGYKIIGLPVAGFDRKNIFKNISVLMKATQSRQKAKNIVCEFKPNVCVGVGGYASGPMLSAAAAKGIPYLLQEQNSYAGITNKLLANKASKICVAYDGMERFFPKEKIILTGNPIRQELLELNISRELVLKSYGLNPDKRTILIVGGSLGARTINESVITYLDVIRSQNIQIIWQTGKYYSESIQKELKEKGQPENMYITDFVQDMAKAYKAVDLVISRAGASTISELCLLGMPSILVPSPNVAEDHQTKNAMALVQKKAAVMVKDSEARLALIPKAIELINKPDELLSMSKEIQKMAFLDSAKIIAKEVMRLAGFSIAVALDEKKTT